jgi:ribosome assembly protein 1
MASILDQNADNLKAAFASNTASGGHGGDQDVHAATGNSSSSSSSSAIEDLEMLGKRLQTIATEHARNSTALREALKKIWLVGPKRCGPNFLLASSSASSVAEGSGSSIPSLWDIPSQSVIKLAKQAKDQGRGGAASVLLTSGGGGDDDGADLIGGVVQYIHVPVQLGNTEISRRLGLVNTDATSKSIAAAAAIVAEQEAIDLATRLSDLALVNDSDATNSSSPLTETARYVHHSIESGVASGFELATAAGPLCDEPMWGLIFQIEARLNINPAVTQENNNTVDALQLLEDVYGPFSGQITSATRQAVRKAVLEAGPRLAEAAFLCEITTSSEGLSAVYAVLGRRRSRVLREEMREGSDLFTIHAYLPAEASFGFADELRRRSSGAASASLMLSHWERLGIDPFFVPLTDEEREEFGEEGQGVGAPNLAKRLIDAVRKRKGLAVEQKVVEFATKQRTLARKV